MFINECFSYYCYKDNCFKFDQTQYNQNSEIIKEMISILKYDDENDFINDLLLCVFCVFNVSWNANNPPPIKYININDIKHAYYKNLKEPDEIYIKEFQKYNNENFQSNYYKKIEEIKKKYNINFDTQTIKQEQIENNKINILNFFQKVDNHNAVTTIGTLEFMDKISKYNMTKTTCFSPIK
jgi:hypothetical protein